MSDIRAKPSFATKTLSKFKEAIGWLLSAGFIGFLLWIFIAGPYYFYKDLDRRGWIPHHETTNITIQDNWLVGESKNCISVPLDSKNALAIGQDVGFAMAHIRCDQGAEHTLKVTFYGLTEQPTRGWVSWQCDRREDGFVCKQTGRSNRVIRSRDANTDRPILSYDQGKDWVFADQ